MTTTQEPDLEAENRRMRQAIENSLRIIETRGTLSLTTVIETVANKLRRGLSGSLRKGL